MTHYLQTEKDSQLPLSPEIPVVTSLEQVELIPWASLEYLELGIPDAYPCGTIVVKAYTNPNKVLLGMAKVVGFGTVFIFTVISLGLLFLGFSTASFEPILFSLLLCGVMLYTFYSMLMAFYSKTWIAVDQYYLYCMRALKLKPNKMKKFPRNTQDTEVVCVEERRNSRQHYPSYTIKLISAGVELKLASGLSQSNMQQYEHMLMTVLSAQQLENA